MIFIRAASLHVGATAVALSLRRDLVGSGFLSQEEFDESYASARLTPGTTLLALYASLGFRLSGLRGAAVALAAGSIIPAVVVTVVTAAYLQFIDTPIAAAAMRGASAAAIGVLFASVARLVQPVIARQEVRGWLFAGAVLLLAWTGTVPTIWLLLAAAAVSVVVLK